MACALAVGCSGGDDALTIDPSEEFVPHFAGELVAADTSRWEQAQRDPATEPVAATSGGLSSQLLVGPATLTLADVLADVLADPNAGYGITFTPDLEVVGIECVGIM